MEIHPQAVLLDVPQRARKVTRVLREEAQHVLEAGNVGDSMDEEVEEAVEACVHAVEDEAGTCTPEGGRRHFLSREELGHPEVDMEVGSPQLVLDIGDERNVGGGERQLPGCMVQMANGVEGEVVEMEVSPFAASFGPVVKLLE